MSTPHVQRSATASIQEPLGQRLVNAGLISDQQLHEAQQIQPRHGQRLGSLLVSMGAVTETALRQFFSHQYGIPPLHAFPLEWQPSLADLVPHELAREYLIVPISIVETRLTLAMADPSNVAIIDELTFRTGCQLMPLVATEAQIQTCIQMLYGGSAWDSPHHGAPPLSQATAVPEERPTPQQQSDSSLSIDARLHPPQLLQTKELEHLLEAAAATLSVSDQSGKGDFSLEKQAPIVQLVNRILSEGVAMGASDIHIEPYEMHVRIRYRLDGILYPVMTIPLTLRNAIISRLKILSHLDIAERRLPQDGRMKFQQAEQDEIDVRISMLPGLHGEKIVLRLLNRANLQLGMTKLGMEPQELATFRSMLSKPYGMILVTGPTGEWKNNDIVFSASGPQFSDREHCHDRRPRRVQLSWHSSGSNQRRHRVQFRLSLAIVFSDRILTLSWLEKFVIMKPRRCPSRPPSPAIASYRQSIPTMRYEPFPGCWIWESNLL